MNSNIQQYTESLSAYEGMKNTPSFLSYIGNIDLLHKPKIAIVGSRKPITYTKNLTYELAQKLSYAGLCIVSGGAMGVDALAHQGAGLENTIMVAGTGLDKRYPAINAPLISEIEKRGLVLSQFSEGEPSLKWNFPLRNELIVALGDILIVTQADLKSGTMHSIEFAKSMGKKIFVLPHRLGESEGTSFLLQKGLAEAIYNIDSFVERYAHKELTCKDDFLVYCDTQPLYEDAIKKDAQKVFEYECMGKISVINGKIRRV